MAKFIYTHTDDEGNDWKVEATVAKYVPGNYWNPPEGGNVEDLTATCGEEMLDYDEFLAYIGGEAFYKMIENIEYEAGAGGEPDYEPDID